MIYGYARVSTDHQDHSAQAQVARLTAYRNTAGEACEAPLYVDEDVSAMKTKLMHRPAGRRLWDTLERGDTVVLTKVDRGFRSLADAVTTIDTWKDKGVACTFLDLAVDLSTPQGRMVFGIMSNMAQFESEMNGQRVRETYTHLRKTNQPYSNARPWGWLRTKGSYSEYPKERALGKRVLGMRKGGLSFAEIMMQLCQEKIQKPVVQKNCSGFYHKGDCQTLLRAHKAGYPTIAPSVWLTPGISERLREWESGAALRAHGA